MAALFVVTGPSRGTYLAIRRGSIVAGRAESSDLQLVDHAVSRRHVEVLVAADRSGFTVRDLHSTNGVRLNGEPVIGERPLEDGDVIELGESRVLFTRREALDLEAVLSSFKLRGERGRSTVVHRYRTHEAHRRRLIPSDRDARRRTA
ncbi:MAG: FHA domain-containing protein [Planctomycetota bacterium]